MNVERCQGERLDEYLDHDLDLVASAAVEAHLKSCAGCRSELEALIDLRDRARGLPAEMTPRRELWPEIAARIAAAPAASGQPLVVMARAEAPAAQVGDASRSASAASMHDIRLRPSGAAPGWRWLAAAAVVLVVISSATTAYLFRGDPGQPEGAVASSAGQVTDSPVGLAAFEPADEEYRYTVGMLESELAARREGLQPETIEAVESSLAIIDRAITEARAALAADPTSADLPLLLSEVYRRKVELLQQAVSLSARS